MSEPDSNARTVAAYEAQADRYREQTQGLPKDDWLDRLASDAPPGRILEIGSAHGRDATALERRGRTVHRTDAAIAFVEMQRAQGHAADVLDVLTDEIKGPYAAVLANAVFLHFQPVELRHVLAKIRGALVPGGLLAFSVKVGDGSEWSSHKLDLTVSLRGFAVVEIEFAGRAAHTSQPDEGVDAVAQLGRFLGAVAAAREPIRARGGELLVSVVRGGSAPFTVADQASATVERRTAPGESSAAALEEVEVLLAGMRDEDPMVTATARLVVARESWQLQSTGPARTFATVLDERLIAIPGRTGAQFAAPYWMEAPLFEASGIPALVCGPSGGGLHSVDEWVDLRQVRAFPEAIVTAVESLAEGFDAD